MAMVCVVLHHRCCRGTDDSFNQSKDCNVFSSTFWGWKGMSGTLTERNQKVGRYLSIIWVQSKEMPQNGCCTETNQAKSLGGNWPNLACPSTGL